MNIQFEMFGMLRRLAGSESISLDGGEGITVAEALILLAQARPELRAELDRCAVASGDTLIARRDVVAPGSTLALLPPVAGG